MAYTTINKSTDYFNTKLYTGTGNDNLAITGIGFQPDWIWAKDRDGTDAHHVADAINGVGYRLRTNTNGALSVQADGIKSFDSDGFTVGTTGSINTNGHDFVAWNWKAGTTGSGNTGGSGTYKAYSYSVNTTAGFSIVKYLGNGTSGHTIPHHLGSVPAMIIFKQLNAARGWGVYHQSRGAGKILYLDETIAEQSATFLTATPTSSVISLATLNENNINDASYVAYCFAEKKGFSKFGSLTGNGSSDGTFVYCGFAPSFILVKAITSGNWFMYDNKRPGYNNVQQFLEADGSATEYTSNANHSIDILSNGFKFTGGSGSNTSGRECIFMAFAEAPLVGTNGVTAKAR